MKNYLTLLLLATSIVIGCKNNDDTQPRDEDAKRLHDLIVMTANTRAKLLEFAPLAGGDPKLALMQTKDWVAMQQGVLNTAQIDSVYLTIEMNSGLASMVWVNEINPDGSSKFRGSGAGTLKALTGGDCENEVTNKSALMYAPGWTDFKYALASDVPKRLNKSKHLDSVLILKDEEATIAKISTFGDYGLVLINTHGTLNAFMTGDKFSFGKQEPPADFEAFSSSVLAQIGQTNFDYLLSGKAIVDGEVKYDPLDSDWWLNGQEPFETGKFVLWAKSDFINELPALNNTIVFGNFCFSGQTVERPKFPNPIGQAFIDKNPINYYCYQMADGSSRAVWDDLCIDYEDSLTRGLLLDGDSTGIAHLNFAGNKFEATPVKNVFLIHTLQPNWCYVSCGEEFIDKRDGQVYQTVCIGDQTWMAENLKFDTLNNWCYDNVPSNCNTLGRLYDWETALVACPEGWHLPSEAEFLELIDGLGGEAVAGGKLKATTGWNPPNTGATNSSGFSGKGGGVYSNSDGLSIFIGEATWFWTTDPFETWVRILYLSNSTAEARMMNGIEQAYEPAYSCRCVKDD